jgi:2-keto-3-deoxy-L-rhamnonate aldolase RhmA
MRDIAAALRNEELLIGPFSVSGSPTLVETIGYAGFDFVLIDCEHAATSPLGTELEQLVRAAYSADIAPIVRVTRNDRGQILKAMNFGARAVVVPHINTAEEAAQAVSAAHYAPAGRRSCAPPVRAARHGFTDWSTYYRRSLEEAVVIPLIEEREAVENIESIAQVPGLGAIFFGPFDLSVSMGVPDLAFEGVQEAREAVYEAARRHGLPVADLAWSIESAAMMVKLGARVIALGTDLTMFAQSCRSLLDDIGTVKDAQAKVAA